MNFTIRSASEPDIPAMHRIRKSVLENKLSDPGRVTEADYLLYISGGTAWVADTDAGLAGFAALNGITKNVWALFVAPAAEGNGIGRALHEAMLQHAEQQGMDALWLDTGEGTRAERFYASSGWKKVGSSEDGEVRLERRLRKS